jgi:ketopantoate reductase
MKKPVVIIGMGEMGSVFARGFLRCGSPVYPVVRNSDIAAMGREISEPELVLVAVSENDLQHILTAIPENWRDRLVLLQNELLPADWQRHAFENPTVISVWFEKKKGQEPKVIIASPVYGPHSQAVAEALAAIDIACRPLSSEEELLFELVAKNVYILTTNIAGLKTGGTVGELWREHQALARQVSHEIIQIQQALTGKTFDSDKLIAAMVSAFEGDLEHKCRGRSAPDRLKRALEQAKKFGTSVEKLIDISATANT